MKITKHIADNLLAVTQGGNWTEVSILETLGKIDHQDAVIKTSVSPNTIAALVHHLSYWNRVMVQRIAGIRVEIPAINGFDVPDIRQISEWEALKADHLKSAEELAAAIASVDDNQLEQPILAGSGSYYHHLQGMVEHAHYHLGQIVIIIGAIRVTA